MTPWFLGNSSQALPEFVIPLALWSVFWTGLTLWHAARRTEKGWFIFFLLIHTAGILEIIYLIFVAKAFTTSVKPARKRRK